MSDTLFNVEAEEALLGAILIDGDQIGMIDLDPQDFFIERHRWIFEAMTSIEGKVDYLTVSDALKNAGKLKEVEGDAFLTRLINNAYSSQHAAHYAEIIKGYGQKRRDLETFNKAARDIHSEKGLDRAWLFDALTKNTLVKGQAEPVREYLSGFYDMIKERQDDPRDIWGVPTGFIDVDHRLGGLHPQQTTIIAGAPSVGKTLFVMQAAYQIAEQGHKVVVYSLEMDANRLLTRIVSAMTKIPTRTMMAGKLNGQWGDFTKAVEKLETLPLFISDIPIMDTSTLRADVARLKATKNIEVAVLDYLDCLTDNDGANDTENTKLKSLRWQATCREFNIHGLTVQSVTKEGMDTIVPKLSSVAGPAKLAFVADSIFLMVRDEGDQGTVSLLPAKLRDGDMGRAPITLFKHTAIPKFENIRHEPVKQVERKDLA